MNPKQLMNAQVDEKGNLVLPAEFAERFGLLPGSQVQIEEGLNEFHVLRPLDRLAKVYIEVTNMCNLDCVTCMRNIWDEPLGRMSRTVFERVLDGIKALPQTPSVFFGGFGEPLVHSGIAEMVRRAKNTGATVELITNGLLLTEQLSYELIEAGLDMLWISIDGASPESYADVRLGASLPKVIENLKTLLKARCISGFQHDPKPHLGIAFVAMKKNIADLPDILRLGTQLGAKRFSVSNVLARTPELNQEILYKRALSNHGYFKDTQRAIINLPRLDYTAATSAPLLDLYSHKYVLQLAGKPTNRALDTCPFIEQGATAIRWDGAVSPCLPLLHTSDNYLYHYQRRTHAFSFGSLQESSLEEIWSDPEYQAYRQRVRQFDFSPCTFCSGCEISKENCEDCLDNPSPTCGGCLWGQGLIQCP